MRRTPAQPYWLNVNGETNVTIPGSHIGFRLVPAALVPIGAQGRNGLFPIDVQLLGSEDQDVVTVTDTGWITIPCKQLVILNPQPNPPPGVTRANFLVDFATHERDLLTQVGGGPGSAAAMGGLPNAGIAEEEVLAKVAGPVLLGGLLAARRRISVFNLGPNPVYLGDSGVTVANGFPLPAGASELLEAGPGIELYAIAATADQVAGAGTRVLEEA